MHFFILCVNLLTCFFVFCSVLSALHETDGGIYIFHVFLYLVFSKLVLEVCHDSVFIFLVQIELRPSLLYFYEVRGTIENEIKLLTTAIQRTSPTLKLWKCFFSFSLFFQHLQ